MDRTSWLRRTLTEKFAPLHLEILDESAKHAGHPGARAGGGHFRVVIVSEAFVGKNRLGRHRAVHEQLGDAFKNEIHALSLQALTPEEWNAARDAESAR